MINSRSKVAGKSRDVRRSAAWGKVGGQRTLVFYTSFLLGDGRKVGAAKRL